MNEVTFLLAVLIEKEILTVSEAKSLQKSLKESVTNANLGEMITKVDNALSDKDETVKKIDAKTILK